MYRKIDFSTDYQDEQGRQYYKPPTFEIAKILKSLYDDFKFSGYLITFKLDCLILDVYITPIIRQTSWFQSEKLGERKLLASFAFDTVTEKLTLIKRYDEKHNDHEFSVPQILFSCLRPCDFVEITRPEPIAKKVYCLAKYTAKKEILEKENRFVEIEKGPDERVFLKSEFFRQQFPYKKKKGKKNAYRTTKIRR